MDADPHFVDKCDDLADTSLSSYDADATQLLTTRVPALLQEVDQRTGG